MVEHLLPKQRVASSSLVSRSTRASRTMKAYAVARTVLMFDGRAAHRSLFR